MLLLPCWPRFKATWRYSVKSVNCLTDQFTKSQVVKQMSTDFFFKGNPSKFVSIGGEHIETVNFQFQLSVTIVESCIATENISPWLEQINYIRSVYIITSKQRNTKPSHDQIYKAVQVMCCIIRVLFTVNCSHLYYNIIQRKMQGNFGHKLQNCPTLPRTHAELHCNAKVKRAFANLRSLLYHLTDGVIQSFAQVYGFNLRQRKAFLNAVMRYGLPSPKGSHRSQW